MAGKRGGFITGANAKITLGGVTMAFCTDVGYNVTIQTIPVEAMGRYEVYSNEPVSFTVDGSLSVIRYTARAADPAFGTPIDNVATTGNGSADVTSSLTNPNESLQYQSSPGRMLESSTFDIDIFEKTVENGKGNPTTILVARIQDCRLTRRGMTLNKRGLYVDQYAFVGMLVADADSTGAVDDTISSSGVGVDLSS